MEDAVLVLIWYTRNLKEDNSINADIFFGGIINLLIIMARKPNISLM